MDRDRGGSEIRSEQKPERLDETDPDPERLRETSRIYQPGGRPAEWRQGMGDDLTLEDLDPEDRRKIEELAQFQEVPPEHLLELSNHRQAALRDAGDIRPADTDPRGDRDPDQPDSPARSDSPVLDEDTEQTEVSERSGAANNDGDRGTFSTSSSRYERIHVVEARDLLTPDVEESAGENQVPEYQRRLDAGRVGVMQPAPMEMPAWWVKEVMRDHPYMDDPHARELDNSKPTLALIYDGKTGDELGIEIGGWDESDRISERIENDVARMGWAQSIDSLSTHVTAKILRRQLDGEFRSVGDPDAGRSITAMMDGELCTSVTDRIATCETYGRVMLPDGYALRMTDYWGRSTLIEGTA